MTLSQAETQNVLEKLPIPDVGNVLKLQDPDGILLPNVYSFTRRGDQAAIYLGAAIVARCAGIEEDTKLYDNNEKARNLHEERIAQKTKRTDYMEPKGEELGKIKRFSGILEQVIDCQKAFNKEYRPDGKPNLHKLNRLFDDTDKYKYPIIEAIDTARGKTNDPEHKTILIQTGQLLRYIMFTAGQRHGV